MQEGQSLRKLKTKTSLFGVFVHHKSYLFSINQYEPTFSNSNSGSSGALSETNHLVRTDNGTQISGSSETNRIIENTQTLPEIMSEFIWTGIFVLLNILDFKKKSKTAALSVK